MIQALKNVKKLDETLKEYYLVVNEEYNIIEFKLYDFPLYLTTKKIFIFCYCWSFKLILKLNF